MTLKTTRNDNSVQDFIASVVDDQKRADSQTLIALFQKVTGQPPVMWGPSIIGFGRYTYTTRSKQMYEMAAVGFSPRAQNITIYTVTQDDELQKQYQKLGKFKTSKACLYVNRLSDLNLSVLEQILHAGYQKYADKHLDYVSGEVE